MRYGNKAMELLIYSEISYVYVGTSLYVFELDTHFLHSKMRHLCILEMMHKHLFL